MIAKKVLDNCENCSNVTIDDDDDFSNATNLVTLQTDNNSDKDNILDNINHKILTISKCYNT